jgi:ABC-2 type transport system permease protein
MISASIPLPWRIYICIMPPNNRPQPSLFVQLLDLFLIEMTNWRWSWRALVVTGTLAPLMSILALGVFARDSGATTLSYILSGNIVLALMFGNMSNLENHFVYMRFAGTLDYFASLPIQRPVLILAVVLAFLLLSLPSLIVTISLGSLFLRVPLSLHPAILLVIPLCTIPLSGIGALIGVTARNPQEAGSIGLVVTLVMLSLGPVVVPPERLPGIMLLLGRFSPATYAASAVRQTLIGPLTGQIVIDLLILTGLSVGIFWLVGRKMDWRQR